MDNFDLKQFLVKNKLTENSRLGEIKAVPGSTGTTRFVDLKVGDIITPKMWDKQKFINDGWFGEAGWFGIEAYNKTIQNSYLIQSMFFDEGDEDFEADWHVNLNSTTTGKSFNIIEDSTPLKILNSLLKDGHKVVSPNTLEEIKAVPGNTGIKNALDFTFEEAKGKMVFIEIDEDGDDSKEYMQIDTLDDYNSLKNVIASYSKSGILSDYYIN